MKNKTLSIATLLLTGALLFAGCGQTGNTTGNTSSTTAGQETATTEQTDSTAQTASDSTASTNDIFTNMDTTDIDGNKMDSSIFAKNKVTLVNVWNVGCTPCVNEIPDLDKINSEYKDKGAAVYGLYGDLGMGISDDEMAQIKDIMSNANASYTQLRMDGTLATNESLLNIMAYPTTYVVGSDGTILDTIEGSKDYEGWKAGYYSKFRDTEAVDQTLEIMVNNGMITYDGIIPEMQRGSDFIWGLNANTVVSEAIDSVSEYWKGLVDAANG